MNKFIKWATSLLLVSLFAFAADTSITSLIPPYPNDASKVLDGTGKWSTPGAVSVTYNLVTNALALTGSTNTFLRSDGTQATPPGGGGGDTIWTNLSGTITPIDTNAPVFLSSQTSFGTNAVSSIFSTTPALIGGIGARASVSTYDISAGIWDCVLSGSQDYLYPFVFGVSSDGYTGNDANGLLAFSNLPVTNSTKSLYFDSGEYALIGSSRGGSPLQTTGEGIAVYGYNSGLHGVNYAVAGRAATGNSNTNIASAGATRWNGSGVGVGGYFEVGNSGDNPQFETSVLLLDARDSSAPIIKGRVNNGTTVFSVDNAGSVSSQTNYVSELVATNGITLGGVRQTSWPAGSSIWDNSPAGTASLVAGVTNVNGGLLQVFATNSSAAAMIGFNLTTPQVLLSQGNSEVYSFGDYNNGTNLLNSTYIYGVGNLNNSGSSISNSTYVYGVGDNNNLNLKYTNSSNIYGYGDINNAGLTANSSISAFGFGMRNNSGATLTNGNSIYGFGFYCNSNAVFQGSDGIFSYGWSALGNAKLTNSTAVFAFGNMAGYGLAGSGYTNIYLIGDNAQPTRATNQVVIGDANTQVRVPGTLVATGVGNVVNTGASVAGMVPVYTDTSGTAVTPTNAPVIASVSVATANIGTLNLTNNLVRTATTPALGAALTNIVVDYLYSDLYLVTTTNMNLSSFNNAPSAGYSSGTILTIVANGSPVVVNSGLGSVKVANNSVVFPVTIAAGDWGTFSFKSYGANATNNAVAYTASH